MMKHHLLPSDSYVFEDAAVLTLYVLARPPENQYQSQVNIILAQFFDAWHLLTLSPMYIRSKEPTRLFLLDINLQMKYNKGTITNYELLYVPILIMSEKWANFEAYFLCRDDVWYMEQLFCNHLSKYQFKKQLRCQFDCDLHVGAM